MIMGNECLVPVVTHLDSDCPKKKPSNYYLTDQLVDDSDAPSDDEYISPESDSDSHSHYHTMTNGYRRVVNTQPIIEVPPANTVGTGIVYSSAEPYPVRASVSTPPDADTPVKSGVVDSAENVPPGISILKSPLNPSFQGIRYSPTDTVGYAKIPT